MKTFDTNLSLSPVYVDEAMLERIGACPMARNEFRETFGEDAKVPVTRKNWMALSRDSDFTWIDSAWLGAEFLGYAEREPADRCWFSDETGKSRAYFQWPYVLRKLKRQHPEWYAARAAKRAAR